MSEEFVVVETEDLRLVFWPACGGRLISAAAGGTDLLWRSPDFFDAAGRLARPRHTWQPLDGSMGSWANVGGSKTWPAPQGWSGPAEWPGPPDGVLDSGSWSCRQEPNDEGGQTVVMTSPPDQRTGLTVERRFEIPARGSSFRQENTFTNTADRDVTWSIWEVCQVDTSAAGEVGIVRVGVENDMPPVEMLSVVGTASVGRIVDGERRIPVQPVVAKLGFPNAVRVIAFDRADGASVDIRFDVVEGADYPDGGSRAELWMQYPIPEPLAEFGGLHPRAHLVELEVLGPLTVLRPGESAALHLGWHLRAPGQVLPATSS